MWVQGAMIGTGLALGGLMMAPVFAATLAQSGRAAVAAGLAVQQAARRQTALALAEAIECAEDLVAEVRLGLETAPAAALHPVVPGRALSGGRALAPRPDAVLCLSRSERRLRLRPLGLADRVAAERLAAEIAAFPGVRSATLRPVTGSIVVEADVPAALLVESLRENGVIRLAETWLRHPAALGTVFALDRLDAVIRWRSRGRSDLRAAVAMVLRAAGSLRERARP